MDAPHTSKIIIGGRGSALYGKRVCMCITGSVAAGRAPDLARELMRNGAEVSCVMSGAALRLVGEELMHWATGNPVVTRLSGECEHVTLCGAHPGKADLVLVSPCTANTLSKIACGVDDTPVTTVASTALGSGIPVVLVPAMHYSMYRNPFVSENVARLKKAGVTVMEPRAEGGKAKLPGIADIVDECARALAPQTMRGIKVLVTAGATREFVDDVRFVSNPGTGKMGAAVAREAWIRGAEATLVCGHMEARVPRGVEVVQAPSAGEMLEAVRRLAKGFGVIVLAASTGDFAPKKAKGKISSSKALALELAPTGKISECVKGWSPSAKLVLFKAESRVSDAELARRARDKMRKCGADLAVGNDVSRPGAGFAAETNEAIIVGRKGEKRKVKGTKEAVARAMLSALGF